MLPDHLERFQLAIAQTSENYTCPIRLSPRSDESHFGYEFSIPYPIDNWFQTQILDCCVSADRSMSYLGLHDLIHPCQGVATCFGRIAERRYRGIRVGSGLWVIHQKLSIGQTRESNCITLKRSRRCRQLTKTSTSKNDASSRTPGALNSRRED